MKLTVCELFAGVGGFRVGLEKSGPWKTVYANQHEPLRKSQDAARVYRKNHGRKGLSQLDINDVDVNKIKKHNLLVAGFPCQDYSVARVTSLAKGIEGKKGVLWWNIHQVILNKNPNYILLENVDRLLTSPSSQTGRDFAIILGCLRDSGYSVEWRKINAADYFFPQKRKRLFIFAFKNDTKLAKKLSRSKPKEWLEKKGFFSQEFRISIDQHSLDLTNKFEEAILDISLNMKYSFLDAGFLNNRKEYFTSSVNPVIKKNKKKWVLRDVLDKKANKQYYINTDKVGSKNKESIRREKWKITDKEKKSWHYVKGAKNEKRKTKDGHIYDYNEGAIPFPDKLDSPSRTMLTSEGGTNPSRTTHVIRDPWTHKLRLLTPEECEKLNGFSPGYTKLDGISDQKRYFFMGNSLVVGLIEKMGRSLIKIIKKDRE
jgi:DNA (cytosine-5)-methyltransferase 1